MEHNDRDGYGRYGVVDENADGLLCHECGWRGTHLGLHAWRAHAITAAEYRVRHGLRRSKGLIATDLHEKMSEAAAERLPAALVEARDPQRASDVRRELNLPVSAEAAAERDRRMSKLGRSARKGTVVVCEEGAAEFCPLRGAARRRFCSRSCASRTTRRRALARRRERSDDN